jgi:hypothetical protein
MEERKSFKWARRLNKTFFPVFGPAQLSPYGEPDKVPVADRSCPMCGHVMSAHVIEPGDVYRSTKLHCPS